MRPDVGLPGGGTRERILQDRARLGNLLHHLAFVDVAEEPLLAGKDLLVSPSGDSTLKRLFRGVLGLEPGQLGLQGRNQHNSRAKRRGTNESILFHMSHIIPRNKAFRPA